MREHRREELRARLRIAWASLWQDVLFTVAVLLLLCVLFVSCAPVRTYRRPDAAQGVSGGRSYPQNDYDIWRANNLPGLKKERK